MRWPSVLRLAAAAELAVETCDRERAKRMDRKVEPQKVMARQSAMERYWVRGEITKMHFQDGERLLHDWRLFRPRSPDHRRVRCRLRHRLHGPRAGNRARLHV